MVGKTRSWRDEEEAPSVLAELEAVKMVLGSLERLTLEVNRRVAALEARDRGSRKDQGNESREEEDALEVGESVRVVRRDRYYGRVGRVLGRRGQHYWDVQLADAAGKEVIYKKRSGLARVKDGSLK